MVGWGDDMTVYTEQYFNVYSILVNEVIGDIWLAIILALIILIIIGLIKFRMPVEVIAGFGLLTLIMFFTETLFLILWVFVVLVIAGLFYWGMAKLMEV